MQFYQLAKGARFEFRGKQFEKVAMGMAVDAGRCGNVFQGLTEITPLGEPLLLRAEEAEKWKPSNTHWTAFISTNAPGGGITRDVLFKRFMHHYYPAAPSPAQAPEPGFSSRVAPYLGTYHRASDNFTTAEKLTRVKTQLKVSLDTKGNLIAGAGSQTIQIVEVEPGLMRVRNDANVEFVLHTDENGQAYLLTPEPAPWIKTPWYGTASFHALLIGFGLLLFMVTLVGWTVAALIRLRKRRSSPLLSRLARWTGVLFAVVLMAILAGWISLLCNSDPAFGTPVVTFGLPPLFYALYGLAYVLVGLGVLVLVFASLGWARRLWSLAGRLHYSLLALSALSLLWVLWYWNLL
jgi:hypothetical protein